MRYVYEFIVDAADIRMQRSERQLNPWRRMIYIDPRDLLFLGILIKSQLA